MSEEITSLSSEVLQDLLHVIRELPDSRYQYDALQVVLNVMPSTLPEDCLDVAREFSPTVYCVAALAGVAARADIDEQRDLLNDVLGMVQNMSALRGFCIVHLVLPAMTQESVSTVAPQLISIAQTIGSEEERMATLAALLPYLSGELLQTVLREVTAFVPKIFDPPLRTFVIQHLASQLTCQLVSNALNARPSDWFAGLIQDRGLQLLEGAWTFLWPDLDQDTQERALHLILRIPDMRVRATVLRSVTRYLSSELIEVALQHIYETVEVSDLAELLGAMASVVPDKELDGFLAHLHMLGGSYTAADVLSTLAPRLSSDQFARVLNFLEGLHEDYQDYIKVQNLEAIALHLPAALTTKAVQIARSVSMPTAKCRVLLALASRLTESEYTELLGLAKEVAEQVDIRETMKSLARTVPVGLASHFLTIFEQQPVDRQPSEALVILAQRMVPDQPSQILAVARRMAPHQRISALVSLAPYTHEDVLQEVLDIARTSNNLDDRADALRALARWIEPEWWREWLRLAIDVAHAATRSSKEISLEERDRGISVRHYDADQIIAQFLTIVLPQYQGDLLSILLEELRIASDRRRTAEALAQVLDFVSDEALESNCVSMFDVIQEICNDVWVRALAAHNSELPIHAWRQGLGIALRQKTQESYFAPRDALDSAISGLPLHLIAINGQQKEPSAGGPGDVVALLCNINLLRVRQQRRRLTIIAPRQVEVGETCLVQVNMALVKREAMALFVPARTIEIVIELVSEEPTARCENGRVHIVDLAWDKDLFPSIFKVTVKEPGEHRLRVIVSSRYNTAIVRNAEVELTLDAVTEDPIDGYTITQADVAIGPPKSR